MTESSIDISFAEPVEASEQRPLGTRGDRRCHFCRLACRGLRTTRLAIYYVNFVFWTAIAQGGIVFSAAYRMTNGTWGEPFRRTGEGMIAFLPVSFVLFAGVFLGRSEIYPWLHEAYRKGIVVNTPFFFCTRDAADLPLHVVVSYRYVSMSLRPSSVDTGAHSRSAPGSFAGRLTRGWEGDAAEDARSRSAWRSLCRQC